MDTPLSQNKAGKIHAGMFVSIALFFCTVFLPASASAIFVEELCLGPIETDVELTNNCDGTVTADFYYDNPNDEFCFFNFFTFQWQCTPCPEYDIPVGFFNAALPLPANQGQTTHFESGRHFSHSVTFPANGVPRAWKVGLPVLTHTEIAVAETTDAPQDCPIVPELDCVENTPEGMVAHFTVTNYNTQDSYIPRGFNNSPSGTGVNSFTNINNDQGQPENFPAWPTQTFFTLKEGVAPWEGEATQWRIGFPTDFDTAPVGGEIDIDYYNAVVDGEFVNRCENKAVNPLVSCVYDNNDGTATAWFGYDSDRPNITNIPVGTIDGGRNELSPNTALTDSVVQPEFFMQGRHDGVMSATWDTSISPYLIWWLAYSVDNSLSSAEALVEENGSVSRQCAPITPSACIMQSADGNANGYLTAKFGYANDNNFDITIAEGSLNFVDGGNAPADPSIPETFVAGGKDAASETVFSVPFNDDASVSWEIAGLTETATLGTALCSPNELPSCSISGQTGLDCGGVTTSTSLTASGLDPEGRDVSFSWVVNCGTEGDNFSTVVSGASDETLDIELFDPGLGSSIAPGTCTVTLMVSDDFGTSSCFVELASTACDLDCAGEPIVQGDEPNNVVDECGVCRAQGDPDANTTCLDCAGTPNGAAELDTAGSCCLISELDACGICDGNNDTCLGCAEADVSDQNAELDTALRLQEDVVRIGTRQLRRESRRKFKRVKRWVRRFSKETNQAASALVLTNLEALSLLPDVILSCTNADLCSQVSNVTALNSITTNSDGLVKLVDEIVIRLKRMRKRRANIGSRLEKLAANRYEIVSQIMEKTPTETSSCN